MPTRHKNASRLAQAEGVDFLYIVGVRNCDPICNVLSGGARFRLARHLLPIHHGKPWKIKKVRAAPDRSVRIKIWKGCLAIVDRRRG